MNVKAYLAEFVGTFNLVFFGTGAVILNNYFPSIGALGISIAFGLTVTIMIVLLGNISGAHINPAVTIALYMERVIERKSAIIYFLVQVIGATLASWLLLEIFPNTTTLGETLPAVSFLKLCWIEFTISFLLMLSILWIITFEKLWLTSIVVGFVVFLLAYLAGPYTGASMNPARSIGPAIISGNLQYIWVYIFVPIAGMLAAVISKRGILLLKTN